MLYAVLRKASIIKEKLWSWCSPNYACIAIKLLFRHISTRSRFLITIWYLRLVDFVVNRFGVINIGKTSRFLQSENGKGQYQTYLLETITTAPIVWHSWNHADSCKYFYQNIRLQSTDWCSLKLRPLKVLWERLYGTMMPVLNISSFCIWLSSYLCHRHFVSFLL